MSKFKEYSLYLYFKQGDDFRCYLDEAKGDTVLALQMMSMELRNTASACMAVANALNKRNIIPHAEGHHISFEPGDKDSEGALDMLVREKVLNEYEIEEEEYGYDDDDDDDGDDDDGDDEP